MTTDIYKSFEPKQTHFESMFYTEFRNMSDDKITEPGAARFGNFINYYQFNPTEKRLCHLPKDLLQKIVPKIDDQNYSVSKPPIVCLDIGCNSGVRTGQLISCCQNASHIENVIKFIEVQTDLS